MTSPVRLSALGLLLSVLGACTNMTDAPVLNTTPTVSPPTRPALSCLVSPSQSSLRPDMAALAGKSPLWLTVGTGRVRWSGLVISLPPYPGRMDKIIWTVEKRAKGDLRITGKQLDGDGILLFARTAKQQVDDRGKDLGGIFDGQPSPIWMIPAAENGVDNSPPGFQDHGGLVYYPHPGCYQYAAALGDYTVEIVIEVQDR